MSHERLHSLPLLTAVALLCAGMAAVPATAQLGGLGSNGGLPNDPFSDGRPLGGPPDIGPEASERTRTAQHVNRAQAAAQARDQHGGRVLSVRWTGDDYRVKLLRRGEVRIVRIADAPPEQEDHP